MKITSSLTIVKKKCRAMVVIIWEDKMKKVIKFHKNNSSYFEISASLFKLPPSNNRRTLKSQLNKRRERLLNETR